MVGLRDVERMPGSIPLSVVVPSHNSVATLRRVLAAIRMSELPPDRYELIVVDDASVDASATVAARYADTVIRLTGRPVGPAYARNRAAELARGEIVAFVDADILVRSTTLPTILSMFGEHPGVDAVSASHDAAPAAPNFVSQYWNLLLHFGEQRYVGPGGDLASGCTAVRRSVLMATGMYDEWRFGTTSLEGLDLGQRFQRDARRMLVSRKVQVTPLRQWTVGSLCREVWSRSRTLARSLGYNQTRAAVPSEVVFTLSRAMPSALAVVSIVALSGAFVPTPGWIEKGMIGMLGILLANLPVYRFFSTARGVAFAIFVVPLHLVTQSVAAVALCAGWVQRDTVGDRAPDAATQAYAEVGLEMWPPVPKRR